MPDPYTYLAKPTGASYTRVNPVGREQYDQSDVTYDSSTVFYDGVNTTAYTNVSKPLNPTWATIVGTWAAYTGTWDEANFTKVNKPT